MRRQNFNQGEEFHLAVTILQPQSTHIPLGQRAEKWLTVCTAAVSGGTMVAQRVIQPVSELLDSGSCEPFKAGVHGVALAVAATCALYNTAAWLKRRQTHLAINAVLYWSMTWWERCHVVHHLHACAPVAAPPAEPVVESLTDAA